MKRFNHVAPVALLFAAPAVVFAHPGHLDGAPLAHALWHGFVATSTVIFAGAVLFQNRKRIAERVFKRPRQR